MVSITRTTSEEADVTKCVLVRLDDDVVEHHSTRWQVAGVSLKHLMTSASHASYACDCRVSMR
jgi:hypothetical protein